MKLSSAILTGFVAVAQAATNKGPLSVSIPFGDHVLDYSKSRNLESCTEVSGSDGFCVECRDCIDGLCVTLICCGTTCRCAISLNGNTCNSCTLCSNDNIAFDCSDEACGNVVGQTCSGSTISNPCDSDSGDNVGSSNPPGSPNDSGSTVFSLGATLAIVVSATVVALW